MTQVMPTNRIIYMKQTYLEAQNLPRINNEEIENVKRPITSALFNILLLIKYIIKILLNF